MRTIVAATILALVFSTSVRAAPAQSDVTGATAAAYRVGQRVEALDGGKWYKAVVIRLREGYAPYRVHPIGYISTMDHWVTAMSIRPAGSGSAEPIPGGPSGEANDEVLVAVRNRGGAPQTTVAGTTDATRGAAAGGGIVPKHYHCVYFVVDHLVDAAPFTINAGGRYTDSNGVHGTYTAQGTTITFHGGNYNGQRAEADGTGARPRLHILGSSGRRVIDCD